MDRANDRRLAACMDRARLGGELTIGFLGGSITQRSLAEKWEQKRSESQWSQWSQRGRPFPRLWPPTLMRRRKDWPSGGSGSLLSDVAGHCV